MKNIERKLVKRVNKIGAALNKDYNREDWTLKVHSYTFMFAADTEAVVINAELRAFNSITGEVEIYKMSFALDSSVDYIRGVFSTMIASSK